MSKKQTREYPELLADIRLHPTFELTPELDHAILTAIKGMKRQVPAGTKQINGYEACPTCHRSVGTSGYYCKWCGQKIREDFEPNPYRE